MKLSFRVISILAIVFSLLGLTSNASSKFANKISISDEVINPVTEEYIIKSIEASENSEAEFIIIELDTPGGLLTSTRTIVKKIMASSKPVIVYVAPSGARAGSAGVFITMAANIAAMAPSTNIGAAHPVSLSGKRSIGDTFKDIFDSDKEDSKDKKVKVKKNDPMEDKVLNDTVAWVKGIALKRGRNLEWAVNAVKESMSVSDDEALNLGVVDIIAIDTSDLLNQINGRVIQINGEKYTFNTIGLIIVDNPLSLRQRILLVLANPTVSYILLMLGFYGLLFEFTNPGIGFPGIAGVISILIAFYGLHLISANYVGVALIVLSIILFIMEVKIVSYGLLTVGGVFALFFGSLMLFDSSYDFMRVSIPIILSFTISTMAITIFLVTMVVRSHRRKIATGEEGLIGMKAKVINWKGESGQIFLHGEIWDAQSDKSYEKDDEVEVISIEGIKVKVK